MHRLARKSSCSGGFSAPGAQTEPDLKGLYIWGDVGRGKTMLMDLFFATCPVKRKRRVHSHEFMLNVQERSQCFPGANSRARSSRPIRLGSWPPISPTKPGFSVSTNSTYRHRRCDHSRPAVRPLFGRGVVTVATSNVAPVGPLPRRPQPRVVHAVHRTASRERMEVLRLDARTDFRLEKLVECQNVACAGPRRRADSARSRLAATYRGPRRAAGRFDVKGHILHVPSPPWGRRFSLFMNCASAPRRRRLPARCPCVPYCRDR